MTDQQQAPAPQALPQSDALSEARADSLSELFARDPEGLGEQDIARIIDALREQRARVELVDKAGPKPRATALGGAKAALVGSTSKTPTELGL